MTVRYLVTSITQRLAKDKFLIFLVLTIGAVAHGFNMFHFPYYENDEAIYLSRAWTLINLSELAPYTYWYDHAPAGWMFMSLWTLLTGGFFTFGFSINTGRVFIWMLHIVSSLLLYLITRKLTNSKLAAVLSVLLFSLSPLAIYFQRRVLLDNIMVFWILLGVAFLLFNRNKLRNFFFSGLSFGLAFLSKETAIFMLPVFVYLVWILSHQRHRFFALAQWLTAMASLIMLYVFYAMIKGELFPSEWFNSGEHVSLIGTLMFQTGRDGGSVFQPEGSHFWYNMGIWVAEDPVFIITGFATTFLNLLIGIKHRASRIAALLSLSIIAYLARGGIVIEFYIIPLFPFLGLNIALFLHTVGKWLAKLRTEQPQVALARSLPLMIAILVLPAVLFWESFKIRNDLSVYTSDQTTAQQDAVTWMLEQNNPNSFYVIDNYGYIDLRVRNEQNFKEIHHYWTVEHDPELRDQMLGNLPEGIDYFLVSPQLLHDVGAGGFPLIGEALANSWPIKKFWHDGWGVEVWATKYPQRVIQSTWNTYKQDFIQDGRVIDPATQDTTSEGQAYALIRAVYLDDRETFDQILAWSEANMKRSDGLYYWSYNRSQEDQGSAADGDQDTALALLFAYKRWGDPRYLDRALELLKVIWDKEVMVSADTAVLTAGDWGKQGDSAMVNPSYIAPAFYRIFAEADPQHNWQLLADSSYQVLEACSFGMSNQENEVLPPEWCLYTLETGAARQPQSPQPTGIEYSYNAFRVPWRVSVDYLWYQTEEAKGYLEKLSFIGEEWEKNKQLMVAYTHDGEPWESYESVAAYGGNLGYFLVTEPQVAQTIYREKILSKLYEDTEESYWEDPDNYYTQNWGWFATALIGNKFPNLWEQPISGSSQQASSD